MKRRRTRASAYGRLLESVREETRDNPRRAKEMQDVARECERRAKALNARAREAGTGGTG